MLTNLSTRAISLLLLTALFYYPPRHTWSGRLWCQQCVHIMSLIISFNAIMRP